MMSFNVLFRSLRLVKWLPVLLFLPLTSCSQTKHHIPDSLGTHLFTPVEIPDKLKFAGEDVPLEYFDVRESLDRELLSTVYFHSQTIRYLKSMPRYFSMIEPILKTNGVPEDFKYLCVAESGFDIRALSPAKAAGFWQLLDVVAKENGLEVNNEVDERYHIEKATLVACRIFKAAYQKYGSWTLVAAAYNGGRAGLDQKITRQKVKSYYDMQFVEETSRYIFRILALKLVMEDPEKYGFKVDKKDMYPIIETKNVEVKSSISDLPAWAINKGINFKILKMFNPWLRDFSLKNPGTKTYIFKVPVQGYRTR